ncbi:MAG TPA: murein biosynthesis integral membrane protein MurJ [Actinomycetota bacterium]|nr:murein biosynthesis integral membrane protein MurJ [Actinomycetota bacterium]
MNPPDEPAGEPAGPSFVRSTAVMSVGTALSRLTGFLRVIAMLYALGVGESRLADAYNVANTTPNIIYELALGGILSSVFIPVFVEWLETRSREEAWHSARAVLSFTILVLGGVMVLGILVAPWIIRAYTFRDSGANREAYRALASFFLVWFMPQIVFYGAGAVATGLLNAHRRFAVPMFAPILNNLLVTATFVVFTLLPHHTTPTESTLTELQKLVLALGTTLGVAGMTLVLWPSLRKVGFRFRFTLDLKDEAFRRIGRLAGWALVYVVVNQLGYLVVIILSNTHRGDYTAYSSAFIFFQLPHAIFAVSVFTALLPSLSSRWADRDVAGYRALLSQGIRATALVVVPAALGYIALAVPIMRLLVQHGLVDQPDTILLANLLAIFAIGLFSFSSFQLFLRAFYAMQDTRTPAVINVFATGLNTVLNVIFYRYFGVRGLAMGHASAYTFAAITSAIVLRRRLSGIDGRRVSVSIAKTVLAGGAAAGAAFVAARLVAGTLGTATLGPQAAQVGGGLAAGLLAFVLAAVALRIHEVDLLRRLLTSRVKR